MWLTFDSSIKKFANLTNTLILLVVVFIFSFVIFPQFSPKAPDVNPLDLQYFYSAEEAYHTLDQLQEAERKQYFITECTLDLIYPIIYTTMLCFAILLLFKNQTLARLPLIITLFDYLENTGIMILLKKYPQRVEVLANITGFLSGMKWLFVLLVSVIVLIGLIKAIQKLIF